MERDATYRATCGHEVYDNRPGRKRKPLGPIMMGWNGDKRMKSPDMQIDQDVPARCRTCRYLRSESLHFYHKESKDFFDLPTFSCHTYKLVEQGGGQDS